MLDEALRMLPYLKSYIRDIKFAYELIKKRQRTYIRLNQIQTTSPKRQNQIDRLKERIIATIRNKAERYEVWKQELGQINIYICSAERGYLDVPILDESTDSIIVLCVGLDSEPGRMCSHSLIKENFRNARVYSVEKETQT